MFVKSCLVLLQVSELVKKYRREHITVWGNVQDGVAQKCYKMVSNRRHFCCIHRKLVNLGITVVVQHSQGVRQQTQQM